MTHETVSHSGAPRRRRRDWRARAAAAFTAVIMTAGTAHAEARVNADASAVEVYATRSNVAEVLSALQAACGLRVNVSTALDRPISGTFTGSLAQILSRVLQGYNYVVRHRATEVEVTIIGLQSDGAAAIVRARPPATPAMSLSEAVRLQRH
jgi:hypothetical protein